MRNVGIFVTLLVSCATFAITLGAISHYFGYETSGISMLIGWWCSMFYDVVKRAVS